MPGLTFTPVSSTSLSDAVPAAPQLDTASAYGSFQQVHQQESSRMSDYTAFSSGSDASAQSAFGAAASSSGNASTEQAAPQDAPPAASPSTEGRSDRAAKSSGDAQSSDDTQSAASAKQSNQADGNDKADKTKSQKTAQNKDDKKNDKSSDKKDDSDKNAEPANVASADQAGKQPPVTSLNIGLAVQAAKTSKASASGKPDQDVAKEQGGKGRQVVAADLKLGSGDGAKTRKASRVTDLLKSAASGKNARASHAEAKASSFFQQLQVGHEQAGRDHGVSGPAAQGMQQASPTTANQAVTGQGKAATSALNQYTTSVNVPVGQASWGDQIAGKIAWLTHQGMQTADIHLNPPELGPVQVQVQMHNDQANIVMHSHHAGIRDLLESNGSKLRDMLQNNGVGLGSLNVSTQSGQQQGGQQSGSSGSGSGGRSHGGGVTGVAAASGGGEAVNAGQISLALRGEVDLYA